MLLIERQYWTSLHDGHKLLQGCSLHYTQQQMALKGSEARQCRCVACMWLLQACVTLEVKIRILLGGGNLKPSALPILMRWCGVSKRLQQHLDVGGDRSLTAFVPLIWQEIQTCT